MKVPAFILFLFTLRITISRCEYFSAISCAIGRTKSSSSDQQLATGVFQLSEAENFANVHKYVSFFLYSDENTVGHELVINDTEALLLSSFNVNRQTKIFAHGYLASKDTTSSVAIRNAFLSIGNYNIIVVDWWRMQSLWGTIPISYWTVARYIEKIGKHVAKFIDFLEENGMDPKTTTLIGHSLGAHVMGIASDNAKQKVEYIVGLDPAAPSFETRQPHLRLSEDDATFVEVIHTDEGNCGMTHPIGHLDFYPNGGSKQPGCKDNKCSHTRAYELYAASLQTPYPQFYGHKCADIRSAKAGDCSGDVAVMGGEKMKSLDDPQGVFYLETSDTHPFALGR